MTDDKQPTDPGVDDDERIEPDADPGPIEDGDTVSAPDQDDATDDGGA